jgi:hypothetical protein
MNLKHFQEYPVCRSGNLPKWGLHVVLITIACALNLSAQAADSAGDSKGWTYGGHIKYQFINTWIPDYSFFRRYGDLLQDHYLESRLKLSARRNHWDFRSDIQLITAHSDRLAASRNLPSGFFSGAGLINDDRRWFNLTHEFHNKNKDAAVLRLDRFSVGFTSDKTVIRFGRQAISWGNGLLFTPMDILNPFDPTAVDKEYKTGDDMLYGQYLFDNGSDMQVVGVVRRDPDSGEVGQDVSSLALKYHGFWGRTEYDLLMAEHYGQALLGVGISTDMVGGIWRADLVWNDTDSGSIYSAVAGVSYSGIIAGHNWTGFLEYYYNGFGQPDGFYTPAGILSNPELVNRLSRGELFNIGRHYLGASLTLEVTPLLNFTPYIFVNIIDPSAFAQMILSYDWKQDIQLLGSLNIPIGPKGTEYGGIRAMQGQYFSTGPSVFAQLAWYF